MDFVEQGNLPAAAALEHWYYTSKYALLKSHLEPSLATKKAPVVADIGCGLGIFLSLLSKDGLISSESSFGVDPAAPKGATAIDCEVPILRHYPDDQNADFALLMDVLEHVEDDAGVLGQATELCRPGAHVFITVPALPALWSHHDHALGHYRRYTLRSLGKLIEKIPRLEINTTHYHYASLLPAALLRKFLPFKSSEESSLSATPKAISRVVRGILATELTVSGSNSIAGLTAVARCQIR